MSGDEQQEGRFDGMGRLLGRRAAAALADAHVCVIGLGGVGSWTAEALARSGVGALTLIDLDEICVSNVNRQLHTLDRTIGRLKIEVMAERIVGINPRCRLRQIDDFFAFDNAEELLSPGFDYVVDAIDVPPLKAHLVSMCRERAMPLVVVGGAGGRVDPTAIMVDDLTRTRHDGLLRRVRRTLRREYGFEPAPDEWGVPTVFSLEPPVYPGADGEVCERVDPAHAPRRLDCASGYGAASFVTGAFGFTAASIVVRGLAATTRAARE